jgi:transposase
VWTADESRLGLMTTLRRRVTLKGVKPLALCQHEFDNLYLYGAVEPLTGESIFLELPFLDTENFQRFIDYFAAQQRESLNLIVLDNGGFHKTPKLIRPEHIRFVFTPPYTPEVSPIERVFEDVKEKVSIAVYETLNELSDRLCEVIQGYRAPQLRSLTGYPFFKEGAEAVSLGG